MSQITEVHHGPGRFTLDLDGSAEMAALVKQDGHVLIYDAETKPESLADPLTAARYVGVVKEIEVGHRSVSGGGLHLWFDDVVFGDERTYVLKTLTEMVTDILTKDDTNPGPIHLGTVTDPSSGAALWSGSFPNQQQQLSALEYLLGTWGQEAGYPVEYKVSRTGHVDVATPAVLFNVGAPTVVVARQGAGPSLTGSSGAKRGRVTATRVRVRGQGIDSQVVGEATQVAFPAGVETLDLQGQTIDRTIVKYEPVTSASHADHRAAIYLAALNEAREEYSIDLALYDLWWLTVPGSGFGAGDAIYLWDPERGWEDSTHPIRHGGQIAYPVEMRVLSVTWPVVEGQRVYYRSGAGALTDITNHVLYSRPAEPTLEISTSTRPMIPDPGEMIGHVINLEEFDNTIPNPPSALTVGNAAYYIADGVKLVYYDLTWTDATKNDDGTDLWDCKKVRVEWRPQDAALTSDPWQGMEVDFGVQAARIWNLPAGKARTCGIDFRIRSEDIYGNVSATWATLAEPCPDASSEATRDGDFNNTTDPLTVTGWPTDYETLNYLAAGALVKVESEYLRITSRTTSTVTFSRGQLGSTKVVHANGKTLYVGTLVDTTAPTQPPQPTLTWQGRRGLKIDLDLSDGGWGADNSDVMCLTFYGGLVNPPTEVIREAWVDWDQLTQGKTIHRQYRIPQDEWGSTWYCAVKATDVIGNISVLSAVSNTAHITPPSQPAAPTVHGVNSNRVRVLHDLTKNGGGWLERDLHHFRVYIDTTSSVVCDADHFAGRIPADFSELTEGTSVRRSFSAVASVPLTRGTTYYVAVQPVDDDGNAGTVSPASVAVVAGDFDPPPAPSSFTVADGGLEGNIGTIHCSWTQVTVKDLAGYVLRWRIYNATPAKKWSRHRIPAFDNKPGDAEVPITEHGITSLRGNRNYEFAIRSVDVYGNHSDWLASTPSYIKPGTDQAAPCRPPQPTITPKRSFLLVEFNLGGNCTTPAHSHVFGTNNPDVRLIRVYCDTSNPPATYVGRILVDYEELIGGDTVRKRVPLPAQSGGVTYYAAGEAKDWAGNVSA